MKRMVGFGFRGYRTVTLCDNRIPLHGVLGKEEIGIPVYAEEREEETRKGTFRYLEISMDSHGPRAGTRLDVSGGFVYLSTRLREKMSLSTGDAVRVVGTFHQASGEGRLLVFRDDEIARKYFAFTRSKDEREAARIIESLTEAAPVAAAH